ncbi:SGNH/GDSL hydrolase family protein [Streptomyces lycii]|uniref:SGNH/GDSL hydrolase family protein n=1 Tax=Streptomyces lycii TaxID=2654337 RepID=A0ABQ7FD35_9ACTN|nr:SGNH/GDSL hydrolase family protein [Streptomyces lycii]KAF4406916.1 SGNH/GDSL hydrolase family protein [Streptomyces lycii]
MRRSRHLSRRTFLTASAAGVVTTVASPPQASAARAVRPSAASATYRTVGRVKEAADGYVQYGWPGIAFEGRFSGTGVGVVLDDAVNDYDVRIDGETVSTLVTPGRTTAWISGLPDGEHSVRLVKRTESTWAVGRFGGFTAAGGGRMLPAPAARSRQIEFIGDSYTAGYGNTSDTRDCSTNGGVDRNTNAGLAFAALTAGTLGADHQQNAFSGRGMVRNYNGSDPGTDYRTYYERALLNVEGDVWQRPDTWHPQVVVIGLGINDFSTPLNPGEPWAGQDELIAAYESAYHGFLDKLRARYGTGTHLVVGATAVSGTTAFADTAERIVRDRTARGDDRVGYWYYDDPALDRLGCDWHPSLADHRIISGLLDAYLATLPLDW